jgi:hypothetical protein
VRFFEAPFAGYCATYSTPAGRLARGMTFTLVQVYAHGLGLGGLLPFCGGDHRRTSHAPKGVMNGYRNTPRNQEDLHKPEGLRSTTHLHCPPYLSKRAPALLCPTGRVAEARAYTRAPEIMFPRLPAGAAKVPGFAYTQQRGQQSQLQWLFPGD